MISGLFLILVASPAEPPPTPLDAIVACYAQRAVELRRSAEPVETIADAVLTLCDSFEAKASEALYEQSVRAVQEHTGGSLDEATKAATSVREEGWRGWKKHMRAQVIAGLVRVRLSPEGAK